MTTTTTRTRHEPTPNVVRLQPYRDYRGVASHDDDTQTLDYAAQIVCALILAGFLAFLALVALHSAKPAPRHAQSDGIYAP